MKILLYYALITFVSISVLQPTKKSKIILYSVLIPVIGVILYCVLTFLSTYSAFLAGVAMGESIYAVPLSIILIYLFLSYKLEIKEAKNKKIGVGDVKIQESEVNHEDQ